MAKWWVLQGRPKDWERSINDMDKETREFLWAFSGTGKHFYNKIKEGDKVFLFTTQGKRERPKRGIIGVGEISKKLGYDNSHYWPEPSPAGDKWPWRFKVKAQLLSPKVDKGLRCEMWDDVVQIAPSKVIQASLSPADEKDAEEISQILRKRWKIPPKIPEILTIEDILDKHKLLINRNIPDEVLAHLNSGKHVIIAGPPGTGKTELAHCMAEALGMEPFLVTATSEWSRHHVIGGPVVRGENVVWESGCLLVALSKHISHNITADDYKGCLLIIDEFNRANMDRAFGEVYTIFSSTDPSRWSLPETTLQQMKSYYEKELCDAPAKAIIENGLKAIPNDFRIIGTINTFDKSYLYTLSYGLIRRFATVYLDIPDDKNAEEAIVKEKVSEFTPISPEADETITKLCTIINELRNIRTIGTAQIIDAAKFVATFTAEQGEIDRNQLIDKALVAYVSPQLEGLLEDQYRKVKEVLKTHEMEQMLRQIEEMYPTYE